MEFKEVVNKRHSVRCFKETEIPVEVLKDMRVYETTDASI